MNAMFDADAAPYRGNEGLTFTWPNTILAKLVFSIVDCNSSP